MAARSIETSKLPNPSFAKRRQSRISTKTTQNVCAVNRLTRLQPQRHHRTTSALAHTHSTQRTANMQCTPLTRTRNDAVGSTHSTLEIVLLLLTFSSINSVAFSTTKLSSQSTVDRTQSIVASRQACVSRQTNHCNNERTNEQ